MSLIRKLQTGNLQAAVALTAVVYADKATFLSADNLPTEGNRWVCLGYKVTEKKLEEAKTKDVDFPANFAVQVPILSLDADNEDHAKFLAGLAQDYQDSMFAAVANRKSLVNAADVDALIADYFDTTRARNAPTIEDCMVWYTVNFVPAYVARCIERNNLSAKDGLTAIVSDKEMATVSQAYEKYVKTIVGRSCTMDKVVVNGVRQTIDKLIELGHLEDDSIAQHVVAKCREYMTKHDQQNDITVVADVG